jgi:excinuclease ABC subunit A
MRNAGTLSGAKARSACQPDRTGCKVLYVLDEPSIGLHQRDNDRLLTTLKTCAIRVIW